MAEYIDKVAFNYAIREAVRRYPNSFYNGLEVARQIAHDFPAADVREVVRGKWSIHEIYKHEMSYGVTGYEPVYKCSVCGRLMESYLRFDEPIMPEDASFPRFCPNCGADMREGN